MPTTYCQTCQSTWLPPMRPCRISQGGAIYGMGFWLVPVLAPFWLSFLFPLGTPVFLSLQNPTFLNSASIGSGRATLGYFYYHLLVYSFFLVMITTALIIFLFWFRPGFRVKFPCTGRVTGQTLLTINISFTEVNGGQIWGPLSLALRRYCVSG